MPPSKKDIEVEKKTLQDAESSKKDSIGSYGGLQISGSGGGFVPPKKTESVVKKTSTEDIQVEKKTLKDAESSKGSSIGSYGGLQISGTGGGFVPPKKLEKTENKEKKTDTESSNKTDAGSYGGLQISSSGGFVPPKKTEASANKKEMNDISKAKQSPKDSEKSSTYGGLQISSSGGFVPPQKTVVEKKTADEVADESIGDYGGLKISSSGGFMPPKKPASTEKTLASTEKKPVSTEKKATEGSKSQDSSGFGGLEISGSGGGFVPPKKNQEKAFDSESKDKAKSDGQKGSVHTSPKQDITIEKKSGGQEQSKPIGEYGGLQISSSGGFVPPPKPQRDQKSSTKDEKKATSPQSPSKSKIPVQTEKSVKAKDAPPKDVIKASDALDEQIAPSTSVKSMSAMFKQSDEVPAANKPTQKQTQKPTQKHQQKANDSKDVKREEAPKEAPKEVPVKSQPSKHQPQSTDIVKSSDSVDEQIKPSESVKSISSMFKTKDATVVQPKEPVQPSWKYQTKTRTSSESKADSQKAAAPKVEQVKPQKTETVKSKPVERPVISEERSQSAEIVFPMKGSLRNLASMFESIESDPGSEPLRHRTKSEGDLSRKVAQIGLSNIQNDDGNRVSTSKITLSSVPQPAQSQGVPSMSKSKQASQRSPADGATSGRERRKVCVT